MLGYEWVVKAYDRGGKDEAGPEHEMTRLLLLRATARDGKWEDVRSWMKDLAIRSVLLVK